MRIFDTAILTAAMGAAAIFVVAPAAAQSSEIDVDRAVAQCDNGQAMGCLNAARYYENVEDQQNPTRTMEYGKQACDAGLTFGCRLYSLVTYRAALMTHQRVIKTVLEGDPKGEWSTKGDLNMGIEQARAFYQEAQRVDPSRNENWDETYAQLDGLLQ